MIGENKLIYLIASIPPITDIGTKYPARVIVNNINDNPTNWTVDDFLETDAKTIPVAIEVIYIMINENKNSPQLMWLSASEAFVFKKQRKTIMINNVERQHIMKNHAVTIKLYLIGVIEEVDILLRITECLISTSIWGNDIKVIGKTDNAIKAGKAETKKLVPSLPPLFSIK